MEVVCFEHVRSISKERKEKEKKEIGCKLRCVRTLLIKSAEGSRHLFPGSRGTCSTYMYLYLPTVPTYRYLRHTLEQVRPFSKKQKIKKKRQGNKKKYVPSTELAGEGQFQAKVQVAEGRTKESFLYNKNYSGTLLTRKCSTH